MDNPLNFIKILDPVESLLSPKLANILKADFSFTSVFYRQSAFRKVRKEYEKSILIKTKEGFLLPTGLVLKALTLCKDRKIAVKIIGEMEKIPSSDFSLKTIVLREEQIRLVKAAIEKQRGVLVAPTGEGKTLLGLAIISAFLKTKGRVLWLCHTKDLMYQSAKVCEKQLGITPGIIGDGVFEKSKKITMATRQSFKKNLNLSLMYDIVVIDEAHHLTSFDSEYATILRSIFAPVRIGLTATLPRQDKEAMLAIEGFLGPVMEEVTLSEGAELGVMAKIKIRFLKVPMSHTIKEIRKYQDVYQYGVVEREAQHIAIARAVKEHVEKGDSVLILVTRIDHGQNLLGMCETHGVKTLFAQGSTESEVRMEIKEALNKKKIHCVIATTIFSEGINIPELNVIINAAGGKSEIKTMQSIGRGLRKTATKSEIIVYDVFDPSHHFLVEHLGHRLSLYTELGWM
jgi:superfamily II DNA or RNA helicase